MDKLNVINNKYATSLKYTTAGTKLLTQASFTLVPHPSERMHRCNYCLKKGKLQCCSRCHSAYFCGQDCFVSAWIQFHHYLCEISEPLDMGESLLIRTAVMVHSMKTLTNKISKEQELFLNLLQQSLLEEYYVTDTEKLKISKVSDLLKPLFTYEQLASIYNLIRFSSFPITDYDSMHLDPIGIGIYPITSRYIQHSCTPNTALIYERDHQVLIATLDIPEDTPITLNFTELVATRQQRINSLKFRFGETFICECTRCNGVYTNVDKILGQPWNVSTDTMISAFANEIQAWEGEVSELTHEICRMIAPEFYAIAYNNQSIKKKSFTTLLNHQLPPYLAIHTQEERARRILPIVSSLVKKQSVYLSINAIHTAERLYPVLVQEGKWVEASRCAMYLLMAYRLVYPVLYPTVIYQRLIVCRTAWNSLVQLEIMQKPAKKMERVYEKGVSLYIEAGKSAISKIFGKSSPMWQEVVEIQWLFERDQKLK